MGRARENVGLEFEGTPLSSSQATSKAQTFDFEASHIGSHAKLSNSRVKPIWIGPLRSIYIVLIKAKINVLLPFGPLAILLHYLTGKQGWVLFFSLVGMTPLAERMEYATEQLAFYIGPIVMFIVLLM